MERDCDWESSRPWLIVGLGHSFSLASVGFYFPFGMLLADWLLRAFTEVLLLIPDPYFLPDSLPAPASVSLLSMVKDKVDRQSGDV